MRTLLRNVAFVVAMGLIGGTAWAQRVDGGVRLNGALQGTPLNNPIFTGQWTVNTVLCAAGTVLQGGSPTTCTAYPAIGGIVFNGPSMAAGPQTGQVSAISYSTAGSGIAWAINGPVDNSILGSFVLRLRHADFSNTITPIQIPNTGSGVGNLYLAQDSTMNVGIGIASTIAITPKFFLKGSATTPTADLFQLDTFGGSAAWTIRGDAGGGNTASSVFGGAILVNDGTRTDNPIAAIDARGDIRFSGSITTPNTAGGLLSYSISTGMASYDVFGKDASTNGLWLFRSRRSDGANAVNAATLDGAGNASFAGGVNATKLQVNGVDVVNAQPCFNTAASTDITGTNTKTYFSVSCKIPAGSLNTAGDAVKLSMRGLYSGNVTDTMTMTLEACQVQGCASGTKVTVHTAAAITLTAVSNQGFELDTQIVSFTTGAAGGHDAQGKIFYELTGTTATPDWLPNTATIAWDDTVDEYLTMSVTFSTNSGNNHASIRNLVGTIQ